MEEPMRIHGSSDFDEPSKVRVDLFGTNVIQKVHLSPSEALRQVCKRRIEVAPFGQTVFSIFKWTAGRSRCRFHRGQHREVSFIRGLVRQT